MGPCQGRYCTRSLLDLVRNSAGKTPENIANLGTATLISVHVLLGAALTVLAAVFCAHVFRGTRAVAGEAAG